MTNDECQHSSCLNCPSRHSTEWRDLNAQELEAIDGAKLTRRSSPGTILFHQGDEAGGIYCIQSGLVGLRHIDEHGNSSLVKTCSTGTTVGYQAFLSKTAYSNSAEILIDSEVCFIHSSAISRLLVENPKLGERFLQHSISDFNELESSYTRNQSMDAKSRFLHILMVFYRQYGFADNDGCPRVDIPVTRGDLAGLLGIQPESMSRTLRKVQDEGLVAVNDRRVTFLRMDDVMNEAGIAE